MKITIPFQSRQNDPFDIIVFHKFFRNFLKFSLKDSENSLKFSYASVFINVSKQKMSKNVKFLQEPVRNFPTLVDPTLCGRMSNQFFFILCNQKSICKTIPLPSLTFESNQQSFLFSFCFT